MTITINISGAASAVPRVPAAGTSAELAAIGAGARDGSAPSLEPGAGAQAAVPGQRFQGGAPSPALVLEVDAALSRLASGAAAPVAASDGVNAGAAPA